MTDISYDPGGCHEPLPKKVIKDEEQKAFAAPTIPEGMTAEDARKALEKVQEVDENKKESEVQ